MRIPSLDRILSWLRSPGSNLDRQILHGGIWSVFLNVSDRVFDIVRIIILARLLSPSDFGIMGIALLTITAMSQISDVGLDTALIQREKNNIDHYLNTVWTLKIGRALVLFVITFAAAPLIGTVLNEPRAIDVVRVLGIGIILTSFTNPSIVYLQKDIEFHKQFVYRMSGTVLNLAVAAGFALVYKSVWALVYGHLAGRTVRLGMSYVLVQYRPGLSFNRDRAAELLDFGKWVWATTTTTFLAKNGDDAFVAWFIGSQALGYYQMGYRFANAPATEVSHVISAVMFPAYSKVQNERKQLRRIFETTVRIVSVVAFPMGVGLILIAPSFTRVVLGPEWVPMVPAMQILAAGGLIRALVSIGGSLFDGFGVPEWNFRMNLVRLLVIFATIWPLTARWGITGASTSITLGVLASLPIWLYKTAEITRLEYSQYLKILLVPTVATAVMSGPVLTVLEATPLRLVAGIFVGVSVYTATGVLLYRVWDENPARPILQAITE